MLRPQFKDESAKVIAAAIEKSLEEYEFDRAKILATKHDLAEVKAELIKWMFIF